MHRFHFKLQKLLNLKHYKEQEWELKLGEITGRMEELRMKIDECGRRRMQGFQQRAAGVGDFFAMTAADNYVRRMEQQAGVHRRELDRLAEERKAVQARYLEASKERKVFEKLKERQQEAFYREERALEVKLQDDINSGAAARRIEAGGG